MDLNRLLENDSVFSLLHPVIDEYQNDRRAGCEKPLESYLAAVSADLRELLLPELVRIDLESLPAADRQRRVQSYCERFPGHETSLSTLLTHVSCLPAVDAAPPIVGPYQLLEKLGRGGMGVVWRARQSRPIAREVAVKLMHDAFASEQHILRFEAERQALALMEHPHIAKVFDGGEAPDGRPYYVMELIDGEPFGKYCERHQLSIDQRIRLFLLVCRAVEHAHQKAVIHRDIKPSNVLVMEQDGEAAPRVIDFGLAKALGTQLTERAAETEVGQLVGTLKYMSPEQVEGSAGVDTRTDVYSLGVMLYETFTGVTPLDACGLSEMSLSEAFSAIKQRDPPLPSRLVAASLDSTVNSGLLPRELRARLSGDLDAIAMKALEKQPSRRYSSVADLAEDLERHLRYDAVEARPTSALEQVRKFARKHRAVVAATSAIVLVLAATATLSTWQLLRANSAILERDRAIEEKDAALTLEVQAREKEQAAKKLADARYEDSEASIDFITRLIGVGSPDASPNRNISLREVIDRAALTIHDAPDINARPMVEARLRLTIGQVYLTLSELKSAETHLNVALAILEKHATPEGRLRWSALHALGELYRVWGRYGRATEMLELAHRRRSELYGEPDTDTLESATSLSALYIDIGRFGDAQAILDGALALYDQETSPDPRFLTGLTANRGQLHSSMGRHDLAVAAYLGFLESEHGLPPTDPGIMHIRGNLAFAYADLGDLRAAEDTLRELLDMQEKTLGARSLEHLRSRQNLLTIRHDLGDADITRKMELLLQEVEEVAGPDYLGSIALRSNLGNRYAEQNRFDDARRELTRVLELRTAQLGDDHPSVARSMQFLGDLECNCGNFEESEKWYDKALDLHSRRTDGDTMAALAIRRSMATMQQARGDHAAAEAILKQVVARAEEALPQNHDFTVSTRLMLGELYNVMHSWKQAAEVLRGVYQIAKESTGEESSTTLRALVGLAYTTRYIDLEESKRLTEIALQSADSLPRGHPVRLKILETASIVLSGEKGRAAEAVALAREAYEIQCQVIGPHHMRTLRTLNVLAHAYADNDQPGEAAASLKALVTGARLNPQAPQAVIEDFEKRYEEQQRIAAQRAADRSDPERDDGGK